MATVIGSDGDDFIHVLGDGQTPPDGHSEIAEATNEDDIISGGGGDDIIYAGNGFNTIEGGAGTDKLFGGAGIDVFYYTTSNDVNGLRELLAGGDGFDQVQIRSGSGTFDFSAARFKGVESLFIAPTSNAGLTVILTGSQLNKLETLIAGNSSFSTTIVSRGHINLTDTTVGGVSLFRGSDDSDTFLLPGMDNDVTVEGGLGDDRLEIKSTNSVYKDYSNILDGGDGDDILSSGIGHNTLLGGEGKDQLYGGKQSDLLDGGDRLVGGGGQDMLYGGGGADRFVLADVKHSGAGANKRDVITDFSQADGDRIDLSGIDADKTLAGNQAFHPIEGGAFTGEAGELIQFNDGAGNTLVQGDIDGDSQADFALLIQGGLVLLVSDFLL